MKKIKLILSIILISLMIIKMLSSCSFAMTIQDFEDFINSGVTWQQNYVGYTNYNVLLQTPQAWINSNAWYNYRDSLDISNYENALIRTNNYNGTLKKVIVYFFNDDNATYTLNKLNSINTGIGETGNLNINKQMPVKRLEFQTTTNNNTDLWQFNSYTDGQIQANTNYPNYECLFMIKQPITNQQNLNYIGYNVFNQIKAYDRTNNTIGKIADIRIGNFYDPYDLSYRLYTQLSGSKRYIPFDYEITYASGENYNGKLAELKTINIKQIVNSDYCYIEMIDNNGVLITSNKFSIHFDNDSTINNYGNTYNASGDYTGTIDLSGVINAINTETYVIYSGDQQIINELKYIESGENLRFQYWVGFFHPSGDNSNSIFNESGDIFGIKYRDIDNFGIFDFILNTFNSLHNLLFNNTQNVFLNMGQFGVLNSGDFVISNNSINNFLRITVNPTLILITIFFYYRFIKMVATINLKVFDSYDIDNNIKLF